MDSTGAERKERQSYQAQAVRGKKGKGLKTKKRLPFYFFISYLRANIKKNCLICVFCPSVGVVKVRLSSLLSFQHWKNWNSKQKKSPHKKLQFDHNFLVDGGGGPRLCGAHKPKLPLFLTSPLSRFGGKIGVEELECQNLKDSR